MQCDDWKNYCGIGTLEKLLRFKFLLFVYYVAFFAVARPMRRGGDFGSCGWSEPDNMSTVIEPFSKEKPTKPYLLRIDLVLWLQSRLQSQWAFSWLNQSHTHTHSENFGSGCFRRLDSTRTDPLQYKFWYFRGFIPFTVSNTSTNEPTSVRGLIMELSFNAPEEPWGIYIPSGPNHEQRETATLVWLLPTSKMA